MKNIFYIHSTLLAVPGLITEVSAGPSRFFVTNPSFLQSLVSTADIFKISFQFYGLITRVIISSLFVPLISFLKFLS